MTPSPRILLCAGLVLAVMIAFTTAPGSREAQTARMENAEDVRRGLHCLSGWDGAHRAVVEAIRPGLWNPVSFEHIETRVLTEIESGTHRLFMKYRSRDERGAWATGYAAAEYDNRTCEARAIRTIRG